MNPDSEPDYYGMKKAIIVGGGIASLASAVYLIREAGFAGANIRILEQDKILGGALDGSGSADEGYLIRGGRMHEEHFVCTWDLLSGIPTLDDPDKSVLAEILEFNARVVTCSISRLVKDGKKMDVSSYGLGIRDRIDTLRLLLSSEDSLAGKRIDEWFSPRFFTTVFWLLWSTTFAFQRWSGIIEMRRYFIRFIHLLPGFNQLKGIMRTVYNQYDSIILPLESWLRRQSVRFSLDCTVTDIDFAINKAGKTATAIHLLNNGVSETISLSDNDYLFVTLGSMVENARIGTMMSPAPPVTRPSTGAWALWKKLAQRHTDFGRPEVFCEHIDQSKWMSFTVTLKDATFFSFMETFTGNTAGTGGLVTLSDSNWLMSVVLAHQPHFANQPDGVFVFWGDGLLPNNEGNYVKKKMSDCCGEEILTELFSHLQIMDRMQAVMSEINCLPCLMPYIDSQFLPRAVEDRPRVVPEGSTNFAFLGQFVEVPDDCVFTVEYSVRTAQTAVYSLLDLDREPLPVYQGGHDIGVLVNAFKAINR